MGDSPCLKWQKQQDDLNVCGPREYKFVFLVWDVHPLSILFKMGGIAHLPSARSPPSPGPSDPILSLGAHLALTRTLSYP